MVNTFAVIMSMCTNLDEYGIYTFTVIMSMCINNGEYGIHLHCIYVCVHKLW